MRGLLRVGSSPTGGTLRLDTEHQEYEGQSTGSYNVRGPSRAIIKHVAMLRDGGI